MDAIKLSRLVGLTCKFTDDSGVSAKVIVTRFTPDGFDMFSYGNAVEGYSMVVLEDYFTNKTGARLPIFSHDRIWSL